MGGVDRARVQQLRRAGRAAGRGARGRGDLRPSRRGGPRRRGHGAAGRCRRRGRRARARRRSRCARTTSRRRRRPGSAAPGPGRPRRPGSARTRERRHRPGPSRRRADRAARRTPRRPRRRRARPSGAACAASGRSAAPGASRGRTRRTRAARTRAGTPVRLAQRLGGPVDPGGLAGAVRTSASGKLSRPRSTYAARAGPERADSRWSRASSSAPPDRGKSRRPHTCGSSGGSCDRFGSVRPRHGRPAVERRTHHPQPDVRVPGVARAALRLGPGSRPGLRPLGSARWVRACAVRTRRSRPRLGGSTR